MSNGVQDDRGIYKGLNGMFAHGPHSSERETGGEYPSLSNRKPDFTPSVSCSVTMLSLETAISNLPLPYAIVSGRKEESGWDQDECSCSPCYF